MIIYSKVVIDMASGEILEQVGSEYSGPVALCKGATSEQKDLQRKQAAAYDQATQEAAQRFGEQSEIFKQLLSATQAYLLAGPDQAGIDPGVQIAMINSSFGAARDQVVKNFAELHNQYTKTLEKGSEQFGFDPTEEAALRTDAFETSSGQFKMAADAAAESAAASGGGMFAPSGARAQTEAKLAADAARASSEEQRKITEKGYDVGRQKYAEATGVLGHEADTLSNLDDQTASAKLALANKSLEMGENRFNTALNTRAGIAGLQSPTGYTNAATSAGSAAGSTAKDIAEEQKSPWAAVAGSLIGAGATLGAAKISA
jgi:hypothetical protein